MHTAITATAIDAQRVLDAVGAAEDGAVVLFLGTVRRENDGRQVTGMRYDAYVEMAEGVLAGIARAAAAHAGTDRIAVEHRIGELAIGDVSVAIAVSTPHRNEAFEAARFVIEEIKRRLPVWKQEHYTDGAASWLEGSVPPVTR